MRRHHADAEICLTITEFMPIGPIWLQQLSDRLIEKFTKATHWIDQIVDALADGYSTPDKIRLLLKRGHDTYSMRDILLIIHWFFRGVSACDGQYTLEYRMRPLRQQNRQTSNFLAVANEFY